MTDPTTRGFYVVKLTNGFKCKSLPFVEDPRGKLTWHKPDHLEVIKWSKINKD